MGELRITCLGSFHASIGERPLGPYRTSKVKALFIYLVVEAKFDPEVSHRRESLMELLWPELSLKSAQNNLRQTLFQLRQIIPEHLIAEGRDAIRFLTSDRTSIGLDPEYPFELDVDQFIQYLSQNRLSDAVALYQGDFLANFYLPDSCAFEEWATSWRSECRRWALDALDNLTVIHLERGQFKQAQRYAQKQLCIDDLRERAYRQLMEALACSDRRSEALALYELCYGRLVENLNITPNQETEDLYRRIKRDELQTQTTTSLIDGQPTPPVIAEQPTSIAPAVRDEDVDRASVFVARERELAVLADALEDSCGGQGRLLFVIGGAGRGKTALACEFARLAQADPDLLVASGRCLGQTGFGDPYLPFREILAQLTGDMATLSSGNLITNRQAQRLWMAMPVTIPLLVNVAPDLVDSLIAGTALRHRAATFASAITPWFGQLCDLLDNPYRQNLAQDHLFSLITTFLKAISHEQPLLLILEDLHYADTSTISLFFHLCQEITDCPILLLATYRPEEIALERNEERHPLANITGELKRQYGDIWLDLGQMTASTGRDFVDALLDTEPNRLEETFRTALFNRTGGHALFTVELLRAMQERGDLIQDEDGLWSTGEIVDWQALPAKVEGVIEQRLNRLDPELQSALTIASVEGEIFAAEVVARVQKKDESQMVRRFSREVQRLHRLVQAETLAWAGTQRLSRYAFRHQMFQQYLYDSLDEMEQAYLHEDVGRALEELYGSEADRVASRLAWHFEQAGLAKKAVDYLITAARQAGLLGANEEIVDHCNRGLALLATLPDSAQKNQRELALQIILGNVFIATKGYGSPEVKTTFARANELCRQVGQAPELSQVLFGLWGYYFHQAEYQLALELGERALELAQRESEPGPLLIARKMLGVILFYLGEFIHSLEHMELVIRDYDPKLHSTLGLIYGSDPGLSAYCYAALSLMYMGYPDRALTYISRAIELARDMSNPFALTFVLLHTNWLQLAHMNPQAVLEYVDEQITLSRKNGFPLQLAMAEFYLYWARGMLGKAAESIPRMHQAMVDWEETGARCGKASVLGRLAMVCMEAKHTADGLVYISEAIGFSGKTGERFYEAEQHWIHAELLEQQGANDQEVEVEFQRAIDIARQLDARLQELQATIHLCRFWQQRERRCEAQQALAKIYGWFTEGFNSPDLINARHLMEELSER